MTIFITGATGFIGQQLAIKLAESGHTIHALIRNPKKASALLEHKSTDARNAFCFAHTSFTGKKICYQTIDYTCFCTEI